MANSNDSNFQRMSCLKGHGQLATIHHKSLVNGHTRNSFDLPLPLWHIGSLFILPPFNITGKLVVILLNCNITYLTCIFFGQQAFCCLSEKRPTAPPHFIYQVSCPTLSLSSFPLGPQCPCKNEKKINKVHMRTSWHF